MEPIRRRSSDMPSIVFVSFDLETTGFRATSDEILQIGACSSTLIGLVDASQGYLHQPAFDVLLAIQGTVPTMITELTGITSEMTASGRPPVEGIRMFLDYLRAQADSHTNSQLVLCSWNGKKFDVPFLKAACQRVGLTLEDEFARAGVYCHVDLLDFARKYIPPSRVPHPKQGGKSQYTLGNVHLCLTGKPIAQAHTATADARAVLNILRHIQELHGCLLLFIEEARGANSMSPIASLVAAHSEEDVSSNHPIAAHVATRKTSSTDGSRPIPPSKRRVVTKPRKISRYSPLTLH